MFKFNKHHLLSFTAGIMLSAATSVSMAATNLRFADSFPITHPISIDGDVYWMNQVKALTNGSVTFTYFPAEQIAKAASILQKIKDGVIDVGYVGIGYETSTLPLNNGTMLPGISSSVIPDSVAYWKLISDSSTVLGNEFAKNGVVPVWGTMMAPYQIATTKPPITKMSDFKGLKLRTTGSLNLLVSNLGADPINMSATDTYLAMQRGTADGTTHTFLSLKAYKIAELVKSATNNADFGTFGLTAVMSKKVYDRLTPDEQKAVQEAGKATSLHLAEIMAKIEDKNMEEMRADGVTIYALSPEVRKGLQDHYAGTQEEWIARMNKQGLDGKKALAEIKTAFESERAQNK